jgi:hypothetical protein
MPRQFDARRQGHVQTLLGKSVRQPARMVE